MKTFLRILFTPRCWVRNYPTSKVWDKKLNELLDKYPIAVLNAYVVRLGEAHIWISNYPYAYGYLHVGGMPEYLPSRKTVFRLYDTIKQSGKNPEGIFNDYVNKIH